jgi:hypothetical protein
MWHGRRTLGLESATGHDPSMTTPIDTQIDPNITMKAGGADMPTSPGTTGLDELAIDRCMELLADHHFGRIAFASDGWPLLLPVNYVFDGRSVVVRTGPGAKLECAPMTAVAFEIDDVAPDGSWGWSVYIRGIAFNVTSSVDPYSESNRRQPVAPWAPGEKANWLRVTAAKITGRQFGEVPTA